jgi:hypothetical protein
MYNNMTWAIDKFSELAKSENWTERATAAVAISIGMQNNAPWAKDKLAELAKSENRIVRDIASDAIKIGKLNNAPWADEIFAALQKSFNIYEMLTVSNARSSFITQRQTALFSTPVMLSRNSTLNHEGNIHSNRLVQPTSLSSQIPPSIGQMGNFSVNHQFGPQFAQGTMVPYAEYMRQQTELTAAYQEINRLKGELAKFQAPPKISDS